MSKKSGQSVTILEYTLLLTTLATAIVWSANKHLKPAVEEIFTHSVETIEVAAAKLPR